MKRFAGKINTGLLFILLQTILYGAFLTLDLSGGSISLSSKIKFVIIILCFCYAVFLNDNEAKGLALNSFPFRKDASKSIIFLLQAAIFLTVISDLFILILDYYLYGVLVFIMVQQLYGLRIAILKEMQQQGYQNDSIVMTPTCVRKQIILRYLRQVLFQGIITAIIIMILNMGEVELESLIVASTFYFISIVSNVILAIKLTFIKPIVKSNIIFAVGMFLFLLCDINVGLFNLSGFIVMPQELYHVIYSFSSILMWTFYAPAQVLIVISSKYE